MLFPIALGAIALYGLYRYDQSKKSVAGALAAQPSAPPGAAGATSSAAMNPTGTITHTAPVNVPGFNTAIQYVKPPQGQGDVPYPPATTQTDPSSLAGKNAVIKYQAAQPIPSGMSYYPAPDDVSLVVSARLGGTSAARLTGGGAYAKAHPEDVLKQLPLEQLGKLNGFVSLSDFAEWVKAGKPLALPQGGFNDVSGPVPNAKGTIR